MLKECLLGLVFIFVLGEARFLPWYSYPQSRVAVLETVNVRNGEILDSAENEDEEEEELEYNEPKRNPSKSLREEKAALEEENSELEETLADTNSKLASINRRLAAKKKADKIAEEEEQENEREELEKEIREKKKRLNQLKRKFPGKRTGEKTNKIDDESEEPEEDEEEEEEEERRVPRRRNQGKKKPKSEEEDEEDEEDDENKEKGKKPKPDKNKKPTKDATKKEVLAHLKGRLPRSYSRSCSGGFSKADRNEILLDHNTFRSEIARGVYKEKNGALMRAAANMAELTYDCDLERSAQKVAKKCVFEHSHMPGVGENLYQVESDGGDELEIRLGVNASNSWASEFKDKKLQLWKGAKDLVFNRRAADSGVGHATQMAWATTTRIGCGAARCENNAGEPNLRVLVVCQYGTPGNVLNNKIYEDASKADACSECDSCDSVTKLCI